MLSHFLQTSLKNLRQHTLHMMLTLERECEWPLLPRRKWRCRPLPRSVDSALFARQGGRDVCWPIAQPALPAEYATALHLDVPESSRISSSHQMFGQRDCDTWFTNCLVTILPALSFSSFYRESSDPNIGGWILAVNQFKG